MKLGAIGEEMVATAVKLAAERGAEVEALFVIRVPLERPLDAELDEQEERAAASLAEAELLGADLGVQVRAEAIRARSIGEAIVYEAARRGNDLIVSARRRGGGGSRASSRPRSNTSCARRLARCSWWPFRRACWRKTARIRSELR